MRLEGKVAVIVGAGQSPALRSGALARPQQLLSAGRPSTSASVARAIALRVLSAGRGCISKPAWPRGARTVNSMNWLTAPSTAIVPPQVARLLQPSKKTLPMRVLRQGARRSGIGASRALPSVPANVA
jgi:hypothetical protein